VTDIVMLLLYGSRCRAYIGMETAEMSPVYGLISTDVLPYTLSVRCI